MSRKRFSFSEEKQITLSLNMVHPKVLINLGTFVHFF